MTVYRKLSTSEVLDRVEDYISYNGPDWLVEAANHSVLDMQTVCIRLDMERYWAALYSRALDAMDISKNDKGEFYVIR